MPLVAKSTSVSSASPVTPKGTIKIGGKLTGKLGDTAISTPVSITACHAAVASEQSTSGISTRNSNTTVPESVPVEASEDTPASELSTASTPPLGQS